MSFSCTRCEGSGFLNIHQVPDNVLVRHAETGDGEVIVAWIRDNSDHDVGVCDCCGDGEGWYGTPGEHEWNNPDDPKGCA